MIVKLKIAQLEEVEVEVPFYKKTNNGKRFYKIISEAKTLIVDSTEDMQEIVVLHLNINSIELHTKQDCDETEFLQAFEKVKNILTQKAIP